MEGMPLGIYISVPFCRTKCSYCNFASGVFSRAVFERYVDRLCADIQSSKQIAADMEGRIEPAVDSIYLGGGTPTVLEVAQLERVFATVRSYFDVHPSAEVTVECAPGTLTSAVIESLLRCGVNRVSLGVQSFVDQEAAAVGRLHERTIILEEIARLRAAGITNINIDLIAGLPNQTAQSWEFSLAETIATGVPHVSVYMLEVDEDSHLGSELLAGGVRYHAHHVPDEDTIADFYLAAIDRLQSAGIMQYEISNFARSGFESQHNLKYWTRRPYLGFGVDAHSMLLTDCKELDREGHDFSRADEEQKRERGFSPCRDDMEAVRFAAPDSLERYMTSANLQRTEISRHAALEESFFLGLRLTRGVNLTELAAEFGTQATERSRQIATELVEDGLMNLQDDRIRLTPRGRLLSNEVFERFIQADKVAG
jgi:oxygen-independent coproporphyrinogen-3 oxidase